MSPGSGSPPKSTYRRPGRSVLGHARARECNSRRRPIAHRPWGGRGAAHDVLAIRLDDVTAVDERGVLPVAAQDPVDKPRAVAGVDPVVIRAARQEVVAAHPAHAVATTAADQRVGAAAADQHVVAATALDGLDTGMDIVALAGQAVVRSGADRHAHRLPALAVEHDVAAAPARQLVRSEAPAEGVDTRPALQIVGARAAERPVIARAAMSRSDPVLP